MNTGAHRELLNDMADRRGRAVAKIEIRQILRFEHSHPSSSRLPSFGYCGPEPHEPACRGGLLAQQGEKENEAGGNNACANRQEIKILYGMEIEEIVIIPIFFRFRLDRNHC